MHELLGNGLERGGNIPSAQQAECLTEGYTLLARQQARRGLGWKSSSRSLQENIQAQDEVDRVRLYYALPLSISFLARSGFCLLTSNDGIVKDCKSLSGRQPAEKLVTTSAAYCGFRSVCLFRGHYCHLCSMYSGPQAQFLWKKVKA